MYFFDGFFWFLPPPALPFGFLNFPANIIVTYLKKNFDTDLSGKPVGYKEQPLATKRQRLFNYQYYSWDSSWDKIWFNRSNTRRGKNWSGDHWCTGCRTKTRCRNRKNNWMRHPSFFCWPYPGKMAVNLDGAKKMIKASINKAGEMNLLRSIAVVEQKRLFSCPLPDGWCFDTNRGYCPR